MSFHEMWASRTSRQPKSFVTQAAANQSASAGKRAVAQEQLQGQTQERPSQISRTEILVSSSSLQSNESSQCPRPFQLFHPSVRDSSADGTDAVSKDTPEDPDAMTASYAPSVQDVTTIYFPPGWYNEFPPFLSVKRSRERGRGLWTSAKISAGTVLIAVKPHAYTLSRPQLSLYCTSCCASQPRAGFRKCSRCKVMHYCGTACQNADWNLHKQECESLQRWATSIPTTHDDSRFTVPPEAVRCLARIIWKRKKLGSRSIWWKEIDAMQSSREGLSQSMIDAQVHLAHAIVRYMGVSGQEELNSHGLSSIGDLVELISKFTLNSFTLTTPSLSPIGVSVAPAAGLLNHSCDPNVAVVFPHVSERGPELQVVAIRDIPANSELVTSYVDVTLPTAQRRKDLKDTYNFTCSCPICAPAPDQALEDWRERMWCPNSCGGSCIIPNVGDDVVCCTKCHTSAKGIGDILDLTHAGQQALDKAMDLQSSDPEAALRLVQNTVRILGMQLPPSAHPLLALIRLGQNLSISQLEKDTTPTLLETSIQFALAYVKGLSSILGPGHPVRAVAMTELGKLLAVDEPASSSPDVPFAQHLEDKLPLQYVKGIDELRVPRGPARLKRAVEVLQQAYVELCIGFGKKNGGGEVGKSVHETLVSLEKELAVWTAGIQNTLKDTLAEQGGRKCKTG